MTKVIRFFAESLEHIVFPRADRESAFCRLAETARKSESDAVRLDFEMMREDMKDLCGFTHQMKTTLITKRRENNDNDFFLLEE